MKSINRAKKMPGSNNLSEEVFRALISASKQNRETVAETIKETVITIVNTGSPEDALGALELGLHLDWRNASKVGIEEKTQELGMFWKGVSNIIADKTKEGIAGLSSHELALCIDAYDRGIIPIDELIKRYNAGKHPSKIKLKDVAL